MIRFLVSTFLVLSVSFASISCADSELNPFNTKDDQDKAFENFLKLWFLTTAAANAAASTPPPWWTPTSFDSKQAEEEWNRLDPTQKEEICVLALGNGTVPPEGFCDK